MRNIREVLILKWASKLSNRAIANACLLARSTVAECLERATNAGLSWPLPNLDHTALERLLYSPVVCSDAIRSQPDWSSGRRR
jgi:hypothetical protein